MSERRSWTRIDAALKELARTVSRPIRDGIASLRRELDLIGQREAEISKLKAEVARCESAIEAAHGELQRRQNELVESKMKALEAEELAVKTQKEALETVLTQSKRELSANQTSSVLTQELKARLEAALGALKKLADGARSRPGGKPTAEGLDAIRFELTKAADLLENLRFYLNEP